jgi:anthranilate phosphoribosyltransferase
MDLHAALEACLAGETLSGDQTREVLTGALSEDTNPVLFGGFLTALAARGETVEQIAGGAQALRSVAVPFEHDHPDAIDTCGTGGDGLGSFNLSTASAIVATAAGAKVIKHGNRSVSSKCGSADLLEAAGIGLELEPDQARVVLDEVGITFLFAPRYHPAMGCAAPVRRALGVRTLFNFLGPLCNPGRVRAQLLGVNDPARVGDFAAALEALGCERGLVVHGAGAADELTLAGENLVRPVGAVAPACFDAAPLGLNSAPVEALAGGDVGRNLALLHGLLDGEGGPLRDALLLNSAAALVVARVASDGAEGVALARQALDSGAARQTLAAWVRACQEVGS